METNELARLAQLWSYLVRLAKSTPWGHADSGHLTESCFPW